MRYHYRPPKDYTVTAARTYRCRHPVYDVCTLYQDGFNGLAVVQQRYDPKHKATYWGEIDPYLVDDIYHQPGFQGYFNQMSGEPRKGLYPTVTVRQVMWALKMLPLERERWETVFDRRFI